MKLTPEQKAFYEYGEARGILKERKSLMRFTEGYGECSDYHGEPRIMYGVEDAIRDAWQKRAACRAWMDVYKRNCENCKYFSRGKTEESCVECSELYEGIPEYWEPRKEGAMINILLSVRRPYSRYILNDEKHDEVRKTAPLKFKRGNTTIYLYESGKNGNHAIIGKCEMYGASLVTESRGENAIRILAAQARVGFAELVNYLPCWDWGIGAPELFLNAVPLSAIGMARPPQSWQYLTPEQAAILERRASE